MSYILDALRRADSERERGAVPDIHAQPVPVVADDDADADGERRGTSPLVWVVVVLLVALIVWLVWQLWAREAPPQAAAAIVATAPTPTPPAPAPTTPPSLPQNQVSTAAVAPALEPAPPLQLPADTPLPPRTPPTREAATEPAAKAVPPTPPAAPSVQQPPQAADAGTSRIYARHELPAHIQRELPQLSIGGSVYSEDPAKRFVVINGSIVHEGDKPLPGLVLEQIKLKSAVLRYKDYRYEIGY
jgi:general secretion pathway protein B